MHSYVHARGLGCGPWVAAAPGHRLYIGCTILEQAPLPLFLERWNSPSAETSTSLFLGNEAVNLIRLVENVSSGQGAIDIQVYHSRRDIVVEFKTSAIRWLRIVTCRAPTHTKAKLTCTEHLSVVSMLLKLLSLKVCPYWTGGWSYVNVG